ncbi:MAG TPA: RNA degradosome polyphosphate kinase [Acidimicrobiales bacterium]|nr:RNA degradosome polyphosphate kinase [Acidimicrobiales bacterium]
MSDDARGVTVAVDRLEETVETRRAGPSATPEEGAVRRFINRELSWLAFGERVLARAEAPDVPLLERAKFLAIFSQGLDEFFQVRVAGLKGQEAAGLVALTPDGLTPAQQLRAIRTRVIELLDRQSSIFLDQVAPELGRVGIHFSDWDELDDDDRKELVERFERQIFPVLTPLAVDPGHPFPYISNLSLNLAVMVRDPDSGERRFARVKLPNLLPRFVVMADGERFVPLEQVIAEHLGALFPGMVVESHHAFRVTRNADLTLEEDESDDLLEAVEVELRRRRFGRAVRLDVVEGIDEETLVLLTHELDLSSDDVYMGPGPLDLSGLWAVWALPRPDLKDDPFRSVTQARLAKPEEEPVDLFAAIRRGDILVHHPYDSFTTSTAAFITQAATDPDVLAIKQTLYRTSADSPIVKALIRAAEAGKQVAALVELKARFDEQANVAWARALEKAGVHVVYGLVGLKTHTKTALVVRQEGDEVRRYCHIGTGNYNEKTARLYEDLGVLTCDPDIGADLSQLFNYLTGYGRQEQFRKLLVAPGPLRPRLAELIAGEAEADAGSGRITMKMNSLVDVDMIDALYAASQAGVEIDLVVRGICCLRPGVPGLSERIRVRSIVGRFLEHSRIFYFANGLGSGQAAWYFGSADLMPRNLDRRVEAVAPVEDPSLQERLAQILEVNLADDELAWELQSDGAWAKVERRRGVNTHVALRDIAAERARRREAEAVGHGLGV